MMCAEDRLIEAAIDLLDAGWTLEDLTLALKGAERTRDRQRGMVEQDYCKACESSPAGTRWMCSNRPHPMVPA